MDTNPDCPDDLSALEARLSGWEPSAAGLDADAMLFAAGRAAARPGAARYVWPALACCASLVAAALGVWLGAERTERQALAQQLRRQDPAPRSPSGPALEVQPPETPAVEAPPRDSLLAAYRALDEGLEAWSASR